MSTFFYFLYTYFRAYIKDPRSERGRKRLFQTPGPIRCKTQGLLYLNSLVLWDFLPGFSAMLIQNSAMSVWGGMKGNRVIDVFFTPRALSLLRACIPWKTWMHLVQW